MAEKEGVPLEPKNGAGPTVKDEEKVLREIYGEPDENGVYRGDGE